MKKILAILVLLVFVAACAPKPSSYEREDATAPDDKVVKEPLKTEEVTEPETGRKPPAYTPPSEKIDYSEPAKEDTTETKAEPVDRKKLDPAIKDLLDRAESKVKSYSFLYRGPESNNVAKDTYYYLLKDGKVAKIKIKKYEEDNYIREDESTHIYIDLAEGKGTGCCEVLSRCISENVDNSNKSFAFTMDELAMPKTPYEWLAEIPGDAKVRGTETLQGQTVTTITYTKNGYDWEMKLNSVYGLPQLVVSRQNDEIVGDYEFDDFIYNDAKESDFVPPCA
ncbi:hypothetical protein KY329_04730 [Candidatus Woesearchaeota archaeon]|nr:hypothetical protein [Candidatus Woesearchaeota archaeon]